MSKRICEIHGVWIFEKRGDRCPKCKTKTNRTYDKHYRNKEAGKFYSSRAWKEVRERVRVRDAGLCQECMRSGFITKFSVVDHIVELSDGGCRLCLDNLECLCDMHHNKKTSRERRARDEAKS